MITDDRNLHIGIIGAGKIGVALAAHLTFSGHHVVLGSRQPDSVALPGYVSALGTDLQLGNWSQAINGIDLLILATPNDALPTIAAKAGSIPTGTTIIDASNPFAFDNGLIATSRTDGRPSGVATAELFPDCTVARAFSHVMDELLWSRGRTQAGLWAMAYACDDDADLVEEVITDTGFVPVSIGSLANSQPLDPGGALFPNMYTPRAMRYALESVRGSSNV